jgi:hypothetical protein
MKTLIAKIAVNVLVIIVCVALAYFTIADHYALVECRRSNDAIETSKECLATLNECIDQVNHAYGIADIWEQTAQNCNNKTGK